jgi:hypothetical protein
MSEKLHRWIDTLLDCMDNTVPEKAMEGYQYAPINSFNPVEPLIGNELTEKILTPGYERLFVPDVTPPDIGHWDVSLLVNPINEPGEEQARFQLTRFKSVELKKIRGTRVLSSWVGRMNMGLIYDNGVHFAQSCLLNWVNGRWCRIDRHNFTPRGGHIDGGFSRDWGGGADFDYSPTGDDLEACANVALGVALTRFYEWTVTVGRPGGLRLLFVTDPIGAREAFKLREVPDGKNRRDALRNWVSEHWRKKRQSEEESFKVRSHLRGTIRFKWNDLDCEITPSAYDLHRDELLRERAAKDRAETRKWATARYGDRAKKWQ